MSVIYISIGNSDNKLTQSEWSEFWLDTDEVVQGHATTVHGVWQSSPVSSYQSACWCINVSTEREVSKLATALGRIARKYRQDSIAWAGAETQFIEPAEEAE